MDIEKRGVLQISAKLIKQYLHLPEDIIIVGCEYNPKHDSFTFYLKGSNDQLVICAEATLAPDISLAVTK